MSMKFRFKRFGLRFSRFKRKTGTVVAKRSKRYTKNARVRYGHGVKFGRPTVIAIWKVLTLEYLRKKYWPESSIGVRFFRKCAFYPIRPKKVD